jgi:amphi-Trp domain-containing protein
MSDVEVSRTESLSRHEAARLLSTMAAALADGGHVEVELGASTLKLHVPEHVRCEVEVEVDGDEVELEVELKWSTSTESAPAKPESVSAKPESAPAKAEPVTAKPARTRTARRARPKLAPEARTAQTGA